MKGSPLSLYLFAALYAVTMPRDKRRMPARRTLGLEGASWRNGPDRGWAEC